MTYRNKQQRYQDSITRNVSNWLRFVGNAHWDKRWAKAMRPRDIQALKHKLGVKQDDTQFDDKLTAAIELFEGASL